MYRGQYPYYVFADIDFILYNAANDAYASGVSSFSENITFFEKKAAKNTA